MTPSLFLSAAVVGHCPLPLMWMCWTWGYGLPPNVAASPETCSLTVTWSPLTCTVIEPDPLEWFSAFSVAEYVVDPLRRRPVARRVRWHPTRPLEPAVGELWTCASCSRPFRSSRNARCYPVPLPVLGDSRREPVRFHPRRIGEVCLSDPTVGSSRAPQTEEHASPGLRGPGPGSCGICSAVRVRSGQLSGSAWGRQARPDEQGKKRDCGDSFSPRPAGLFRVPHWLVH
jgi:hypothetical protein